MAASASSAANAANFVDLWGPCDTAQKRFNCTGKLLFDAIEKYYDSSAGDKKVIPYFGTDGEGNRIRLLRRSPYNDRDEDVARERYKNWIKDEGLNLYCASQPVTHIPENPWHPDARFVLAAGHRAEGLYDAEEEDPTNPQVQASVQSGFHTVMDLHKKTPADVLRCVVTEFNNWTRASGYNPQQHFELVDRTEKAWETFKEQNGFTVRSLPSKGEGSYESIYKNWLIKTWKNPKLSTWHQYDSAKSMMHSAKRIGYWKDLQDIFKNEYDSHLCVNVGSRCPHLAQY